MAQEKSRWYLSLHVTLYLVLTLVRGLEETDDAFKNGRNLVLEYFLPINFPVAVVERSKRDVEGSGEDAGEHFGELKEKSVEDSETATEFMKFVPASNLTNVEGSGEVENSSDGSLENSTEEEGASSAVPIIGDGEETTTEETSESEEGSTTSSEESTVSTEMVFDRSEDFEEVSEGTTGETTAPEPVTVAATESLLESTSPEVLGEESVAAETTPAAPEVETTPVAPALGTEAPATTPAAPALGTEAPATTPRSVPSTTAVVFATEVTPASTEGLPVHPVNLATPRPVVEEAFDAKAVRKSLQASPGNILRKENLTLGADRLLIVTNTRVMDSEENVRLSSEEPKRLGAYIVIGLILLSFFSLIGYITFRKRMNRKRQEFESNQESNDTEKALLSLSDYKDNSELEENHLKNNEIAPIVVKSNSQINKFEKNTNFSSPKNLNTTANEKNIEKDNVLKSTAENLTQVIIEGSPKEVEEDKNVPSMEKLIVKTMIDQDSIPKKPIIINRSSTGYVPIPQDNL